MITDSKFFVGFIYVVDFILTFIIMNILVFSAISLFEILIVLSIAVALWNFSVVAFSIIAILRIAIVTSFWISFFMFFDKKSIFHERMFAKTILDVIKIRNKSKISPL